MSIEVCMYNFCRYHTTHPKVSVQQIYNWINTGRINIDPKNMCYKRRKRKLKTNGMMSHLKSQLNIKTVFPISLRPHKIEARDEIGHLEIDSIIGKRDEPQTIISIVDRCSRQLHLIKSEYTFEYYTNWCYVKKTDNLNLELFPN